MKKHLFKLIKNISVWVFRLFFKVISFKGIGLSVLVGLILMGTALVYMFPDDRSYDKAAKPYVTLSEKPFDFTQANEHQVNILSPIVAYVFHLRGEARYGALSFIVAIIFLAVIYYYFRYKRSYSFLESIGMSAMMAFSIPISLVLFWRGHPDITTYLLLFLCILLLRHVWLWLFIYALAIWNHESAIFAAPWLFAIACWRDFRLSKYTWSLGLIGLSILSWLLFREYVIFRADTFKCATGYCFNLMRAGEVFKSTQGYLLLGIFSAFRLLWFWPIYAIYRFIRMPGRRLAAGWLALVIFCALAQLAFTWDVTRAAGLAFPAILFGAHATRELWGKDKFKKWLLVLLLLNLLLPNLIVRKNKITSVQSLPQVVVSDYLFE